MNNALIAAVAIVLLAGPAAAQSPATTEDLEQRLRVLERKLELAEEEKAAKAREGASASAGDKGFGIKAADGSYEFRLRGLLQADGRFFSGDEQTLNDTWLLRRMEPAFELTLGKLAYFKLQPQFAGDSAATSDVYGELRFAPAVGLRFGKFKTPGGLEYLQGSAPLVFIERGLPTELGAGRDFGLQLQGELPGGTSYAVAWLNGAPDGRDAVSSDTDNHKELAARLFFEPFKANPGFLQNLGFGIAASSGRKVGTVGDTSLANNAASFNNTLPRYRSPGQNTIFSYRLETATAANGVANTVVADGDHARLAPQLYFYRGGFGLLAEHTTSKQDVARDGVKDTFEHTAWQGVASYVLTGEDASYKGVKPARPYVADGWGAFEVAVRAGGLDIDDDAFAGGAASFADPTRSVSEATTTGIALSWYLTAHVRLALNYDRTSFDGGDTAGDRLDETAVFTRLQLSL